MDPQLQHNPRTKSEIKELLYNHLYAPIQQQFRDRLDMLIARNTLAIGGGHKSFTYKGVTYNTDTTHPPRRLNRLSPLLVPEMEDYLKDVKELNTKELPYVLGFINQVLNASNDLHDYLRLLPQSLHPPIQKLIDSCPCRTNHLSEEAIQTIQHNNQMPIILMKQRMAINLLI